ncbi:MAG: sugar ABC transporter permease [Anaerolineaceae bacterium]|nr:sugar ABC transporter permease [Anaerolineaceae bacterium]
MQISTQSVNQAKPEAKRPFSFTYSQQKKIVPLLFLLIPLALLVVFTYIPVVNMFWYSFLKWDGFSKDRTFIGFENYIEVFTRPELFGVFWVSLYYFVGSFVQMGLALYFATILSFKVKLKNLFKGILFFPYLINGVAIGFIFLYFFKPDGVLDILLAAVGLGEYTQLWLGNRNIINISLASVSVWMYMGLNFVLFLGAIQSIPSDIYEAADLDGANNWQKFRYIIIPSIMPILSLSFILAIKGALSVFEIPYIMTGGANGSATFVIQTVDMAFKFSKVGLASAMAVVLLVIILMVTYIQRLVLK